MSTFNKIFTSTIAGWIYLIIFLTGCYFIEQDLVKTFLLEDYLESKCEFTEAQIDNYLNNYTEDFRNLMYKPENERECPILGNQK